jgi:hypothetical protein
MRTLIGALLGLMFLTGCETPGQMFWSPDLTRAAWIPTGGGEGAAIIDSQGKVVAKIGAVVGGCAWSSDSKKLYFAQALEEGPGKKTALDGVWVNSSDAQWIEAHLAPDNNPDPKKEKDTGAKVAVWEDGRVTPLFELVRSMVAYMLVSPDGKWLAAQTMDQEKDGKSGLYSTYVFSLESRKLRWLSTGAGPGICFTGEHRLALVEPVELKHGVPSEIGELREMVLADGNEAPERVGRTGLIIGDGCWLGAAGEDLLFVTESWAFPGPLPAAGNADDRPKKLFRYVRGEGVVKMVLDGVGPIFSASPDGKRLLLEKKPAPFKEGPSKLAVLDLDGARLHELCDYQVKAKAPDGRTAAGAPIFAAWRGNEEFCFVRQEEADKGVRFGSDRAWFPVVVYGITADHAMEVKQILSQGWDDGTKAWVKLR